MKHKTFSSKSGRISDFIREKIRKDIASLPDKTPIIISVDRIRESLDEFNIKEGMRKFYFSQVANPAAADIGIDSIEFHEAMKSLFARRPCKEMGVDIVESVFGHKSKWSNPQRKVFIRNVVAKLMDIFPGYVPPDFNF